MKVGTIYKVWVQIEQIIPDEEQGEICNNVTEPIDVGRYDTLAEAQAVMDKIIEAA